MLGMKRSGERDPRQMSFIYFILVRDSERCLDIYPLVNA